MMKAIGRLLVFLIALAALGWGGALVVLGFAGQSAAPRNVQVRRTGGERDEATLRHRSARSAVACSTSRPRPARDAGHRCIPSVT
jgi:hypothetical protein